MTASQSIRERLAQYGKDGRAATMHELLTLIVGDKAADSLVLGLGLLQYESSEGLETLKRLSIQDLTNYEGMGEASAYKLAAALEMGRRIQESETPTPKRISCAADAYTAMRTELHDLAHEEFWVLLLSRSNHIMRKVQISSGGVSGTVADPKLIFNHAIGMKASAMILAHNHPSGNKQPSQADIQLTKKLKKGGELLEVSVLDHLIYTDRGYFSFNDEGMM